VLLDEAMSHEGGSNLIVGDVKQSIYRWRSGDWRLLNNIEQQFDSRQIETLPLQTNYRSQRNIIDFNNQFFLQAVELEYQAQRELNETEAEQLKRAYADVAQLVPEGKPQQGEVEITLLPTEDYEEKTLSLMADTISRLMSQGIPQKDIAILVRVNSTIPTIAQYFMEQMPEVSIISDEAFRLDASCAVNLLIQALRLLTHPNDLLAKAALVKLYHTDVLGEQAADNELLHADNDLDALLPEDYREHTAELLKMPIYELAERLHAIFSLEKRNDQSAYIFAFYDQLAKYVSENTADIDSFLAEWDDSLCGKTIQSDETDGIRILSIHKSKGLEYNYIVCPFCDWQLEKQSGNTIWCIPEEQPFSDLPIAPIDYSQKQMMGTIYEKDYLHEHLQNTVDNLNLLYVAFTRACRGLYVIGKRGGKACRSVLIEQVLPLVAKKLPQATLSGLEDEQQPLSFTFGNNETDLFSQHGEAARGSKNPFLQPSEPQSVDFRYQDSKVSFRQSNRSQAFTQEEDEENMQRQNYIQTGSVLHQIFSTIRTTADIDDALKQLQFEGVLYDDQITPERISNMLRKRLQDPRVADWFSSRWTLFNECTILTVENGEVVERRPDRVMTDGKEWIIVDFKFGSPKPEYRNQVQEYKDLLAAMGHQNVRGYLWFVYSNKIEEV
jgi:ATP-dependent exoDNAse (exonuclease V) beta subunit